MASFSSPPPLNTHTLPLSSPHYLIHSTNQNSLKFFFTITPPQQIKKLQPQMDSNTSSNKLAHILKVAYYMLRKFISKHKYMADLHLLLKRGKIAGKALRNLLSHHHHHVHRPYPDLSFYNYYPREVEFSCSTTPSYPSLFNTSKRKRNKKSYYHDETVSAVARAFEMMNEISSGSDGEPGYYSVGPSPMIVGFGMSPRMARQLRVTDSPFPVIKEEEVSEFDRRVDQEAEEFIRRFYEQLKVQQRTAVATPEYKLRRG